MSFPFAGLPSIDRIDLDVTLDYLGERDTLSAKRREHLLVKANHTLPIGKVSMQDFLGCLAADVMDERRKAKQTTTGYVTLKCAQGFSDGTPSRCRPHPVLS